MSEKDPYTVPGLVRGLALLQAFTPQKPEQTLSQLARELGVTRSAAFRTVHTLVREGFLLAVRDGHHYRLGPAVLRLSFGYLASRELLEVAQSPLETLRDKLDWSTHLGVLDGRHILYLIRFPASDALSALVHVGSRLPATRTAMGRVLLTQKSEIEMRKLLADQPAAAVNAALKAWQGDLEELTVVHRGSFESGLCSVAAPVFDMSGAVVAAISATKVTETVPETIERRVLQTAATISMGLGWKNPNPEA
ncbi:IclR family transcriptional regulator [Hoeflea prorocentri]|uniref:IclR family transcriptional regulator n=1 Tax=Hoeflea prorocentri TaxID=1922333 RepID=A0A9X3ZGG5_9HYPH|nr:IclR family transcriptional regulator [Hoeflea prorocentri]MCY6379771.1 IclR family transcriptional regulator [Hoeflea prorocentri]MDA5397571.1 IclR family transcriptional regulator [Hoeflea prorocentri]